MVPGTCGEWRGGWPRGTGADRGLPSLPASMEEEEERKVREEGKKGRLVRNKL